MSLTVWGSQQRCLLTADSPGPAAASHPGNWVISWICVCICISFVFVFVFGVIVSWSQLLLSRLFTIACFTAKMAKGQNLAFVDWRCLLSPTAKTKDKTWKYLASAFSFRQFVVGCYDSYHDCFLLVTTCHRRFKTENHNWTTSELFLSSADLLQTLKIHTGGPMKVWFQNKTLTNSLLLDCQIILKSLNLRKDSGVK